MENPLVIKYKAHKECLQFLTNKFTTITSQVKALREGLSNETKSSAGDKHETGRAMLHLEMEKLGKQMQVLNGMKLTLEQIDLEQNFSAVGLGSLVKTTKGNFYVAISAGKLDVDAFDCFAISTASPLGKEMLGKRAGDYIASYDTYILQVV
jgi:transcription elongation GreA/GreB family factor